ncbi:MAG: ABC transporter substrate-binding protein [Deltaproteobacteria bacterium]|nr:ABC transporter substrate-binding protein [Deltaproteobacteria bacterium]
MRRKCSFGIVSCLLSLFFVLSFAGPSVMSDTAEAKTLKIGLITSVTGMMAPAFKPLYDAAKPSETLINEMGGITVKGDKYDVEVIVEDDQSSPPGAISATNKLLQQGVKYLTPPMFMPSNMAIASITEEAKILRMKALGSGPEELNAQTRYSFYSSCTLHSISPTHEFLQKNYPNAKRIAIILQDDPGMRVPHELNVKELQKRGLELVFEERYKMGTEDYYPILTKAFEKKPDVISLVISIVPWTAGIINQSRELGFKGPIMCASPFGDVNLVNGIINKDYAYDIFTGGAPDVFSEKMPPLVKELRTLVGQVTKNPFTMDSVLPLESMYVLKQCIETAQSLDTDEVVDTIENRMKSVNTLWGEGEWVGKEIFGVNHVGISPIPFSRIVNGKVEFEFMDYK